MTNNRGLKNGSLRNLMKLRFEKDSSFKNELQKHNDTYGLYFVKKDVAGIDFLIKLHKEIF